VNPELGELTELADAIGLTMIQLHGDEGPVFCGEAARRTGCKVIKAVRVRDRADIQALTPFHTDLHLLDSHVPGLRGGTGETFAWELAREHRGRAPVILSGGLNADNVGEAIATVRPFAVDVASGVEVGPGRKDQAKLQAFAAAVARASAPVGEPVP
jgi:phosphoribosylanthranilate isomerase